MLHLGEHIPADSNSLANYTGLILKVKNINLCFSMDTKSMCNLTKEFAQNGFYGLNSSDCGIFTLAKPDNAYLPILYAFLLLISLHIAMQLYNSKTG